jgi:glycosyltransferase involved in cell wall biosynthesis
LGFQANVGEFLVNSQLFVLPSQYGEGCPTSILEAYSYSLPVIAYRVDGVPELVTHNVDGLLFDVGDKQAMALGIISLLLDSKAAMEMGRLGRDKIEDNFLLEKMVNEHNSYFIKLKK